MKSSVKESIDESCFSDYSVDMISTRHTHGFIFDVKVRRSGLRRKGVNVWQEGRVSPCGRTTRAASPPAALAGIAHRQYLGGGGAPSPPALDLPADPPPAPALIALRDHHRCGPRI
jgi:hypothetical protein